jgi:mannose-6-phosphate isomerase-like protein (cupin superfamily)
MIICNSSLIGIRKTGERMSPFIFYGIGALIILIAAVGGIYYEYRRPSAAIKTAYKEFHINILTAAKLNNNFRTVLATASHGQVVLMSILPNQSIGLERHEVDQFLIFVEGTGTASLDGKEFPINPGELFLVPAGVEHNFTNTGTTAMKLFTIYAPAHHKQGFIQKNKPQKGY